MEEIEAEARAEGAYGIGTERHLEGLGPVLPLPPGAELAPVNVQYHGWALLHCPPIYIIEALTVCSQQVACFISWLL